MFDISFNLHPQCFVLKVTTNLKQFKTAINLYILFFRISVVLGEHNTGTNKSCIENGTDCVSYRHVRKVVKTTVHPDYNSKNMLNDIALLQLKSGIRRSSKDKKIFF